MTAQDDDSDGVGYGRPPKSGQFKKGQSGNPTGRPRQQVAQPLAPPARFPTREGLRAERGRMIPVTDASGRHEVPAGQAIIRAMLAKGMQGGVLAQRTAIKYLLAEDERYHRECKENFDFWRGYQDRCNAAIAAAVKAGREVPDFLPHPEDIVLDWVSLDVRFLGAIDKEGRAAEKKAQLFQALAFELHVFTQEDFVAADEHGKGCQIGLFMALHIYFMRCLPPRLRVYTEIDAVEFLSRIRRGGTTWKEDLERRCREAGFPFIRLKRGVRLPIIPIEQFGLKWPAGLVVDPPRKRRKR